MKPSRFFRSSIVRFLAKAAVDGILAGVAWEVARILTQSDTPRWPWLGIWMGVSLGVHLALQLFRQHYRAIGFEDALLLAAAFALLLGMALAINGLIPRAPRGFIWVASAHITPFLWMAFRVLLRLSWERHGEKPVVEGQRTLIVGAGQAGQMVLHECLRHPELGVQVVAFLDDDPAKHGLSVEGVRVFGGTDMAPDLIRKESVTHVILAMPSASGDQMRRMVESVRDLQVKVKTVPGIFELLGRPQDWKPRLRDISTEDLLRREPVVLDQGALTREIRGRVVLITGGGGSIGSELARQVARFDPSRLILLGHGESSLWGVEQEFRRSRPQTPVEIELCDVRDQRRLNQIFGQWEPDVVFHAAAHKHLPFLERNPDEAVTNNVLGTRNVIEAALRCGVSVLVNISTDKAVNPTSILGASKRVAEYLVARGAARAPKGGRFVSVRFGNVLGSRGSVVPIFQDQIRRGGPLTITHPEMARYFMTIPEASQLVLQAGLLGISGQVYVLDMGHPVRILDLAEDMIRLSGLRPYEDIDIQASGIRPGEKLFEELFYDSMAVRSFVHPKVFGATPDIPEGIHLDHQVEELESILGLPRPEQEAALRVAFTRLVPSFGAPAQDLPKPLQVPNQAAQTRPRGWGLDYQATPG